MDEATSERTRSTIIQNEAELRALTGTPNETVRRKQLTVLDAHARAFIAHSPFVLMATSAGNGSCDVSPRGGDPGFAVILNDRRIAIPDRPGNRRNDSLCNLLENPEVGLLFLVPGVEETLRVNGRAQLVQEAPWFDQMTVRGKRPLLAVAVDVEEVFFHCPKSFRRSRLWDSATWPDRSVLPTLGQILKDQVRLDQPALDVDRALEESYERTLY